MAYVKVLSLQTMTLLKQGVRQQLSLNFCQQTKHNTSYSFNEGIIKI